MTTRLGNRGMTELGLAAAAVLLAMASAASTAPASEVVYRKHAATPRPASAGDQVPLSAQCRDGQELLSGGFFGDPYESSLNSTDFAINATAPKDGPDRDEHLDDAWIGWMDFKPYGAFSLDGDVFLRTRVVCSDRIVTKQRKGEAVAESRGQHAIVAACPRHHFVIGGGMNNTGSLGQARLNTSRPADGPDGDRKPDDAWLAFVDVLTPPVEMSAHATCVTGRIGDRLRYGRNDIRARPNLPALESIHGVRGVMTRCPEDAKLVGGGVTSTGDQSVDVFASEPWDDRDAGNAPDDGWFVGARQYSPDVTHVYAHRICLKEKK